MGSATERELAGAGWCKSSFSGAARAGWAAFTNSVKAR